MHVGKPPTSVEAGNDRLSNVMLEEENEVETEVEAELRRVQMAKRMSRLKRSSTSFGLSVMGSEQKEFLRRVTLEEKVIRQWKKRTKAAPHTPAPAAIPKRLPPPPPRPVAPPPMLPPPPVAP